MDGGAARPGVAHGVFYGLLLFGFLVVVVCLVGFLLYETIVPVRVPRHAMPAPLSTRVARQTFWAFACSVVLRNIKTNILDLRKAFSPSYIRAAFQSGADTLVSLLMLRPFVEILSMCVRRREAIAGRHVVTHAPRMRRGGRPQEEAPTDQGLGLAAAPARRHRPLSLRLPALGRLVLRTPRRIASPARRPG